MDKQPTDGLTEQKLREALSGMGWPKDVPIRFELSPNSCQRLREKTTIYKPATPNSILSHYISMPVIVSDWIPNNLIGIIYEENGKERREIKFIEWGENDNA